MTGGHERLALRVDDRRAATVSAVVHRPVPGDAAAEAPAVVLTHGAGGDLDGAGLRALCVGLAGAGHLALRANLPYREAGAGAPPRADRSVAGLVALVAAARDVLGADRLVVGGKSYGGRVASLAVADGLAADGLLFYGYPLHPPRRGQDPAPGPAGLRTDHWPRIGVPSLFLEGSRDPFCRLDRLETSLADLGGPATLHVVEGGDHSLRVTARAAPDGRAHPEGEVLEALAGGVVATWLSGL